jgi:RNA-directed DNA polymerase
MKVITDLSNFEAKKFLLKSKSYAYFDLPPYFTFDAILDRVDKKLQNKNISDFYSQNDNPKNYEDVNYKLLNNKDGKYDWRPFQLIHPALYVALVNAITRKENWKTILDRLEYFQKNNLITCMSLPIVSDDKQSDQAKLVTQWYENVEQKSLALSLEYDYFFQTDITDCYGSIYTHSIPWAIHTKKVAKAKRTDDSLVGNKIDILIQVMSNGQTNGIPQGSVLMDFIAEVVLGYIDELVTTKIKQAKLNFNDFRVIRFRDDYRVFTKNPITAAEIIKIVTEVLIILGMKLNSDKTVNSDEVLKSSLKRDKLYWIENKRIGKDDLENIQILHLLADRFPNSGTLVKELQNMYDHLQTKKSIQQNPFVLISYIVDIAFKNPRAYSICAAILSKLISFIDKKENKLEIISKIKDKFKKIPNTGLLEVWLQRISIKVDKNVEFEERLCQVIAGNSMEIWNSDWLKKEIRSLINKTSIVDNNTIRTLDEIIDPDEVSLFVY